MSQINSELQSYFDKIHNIITGNKLSVDDIRFFIWSENQNSLYLNEAYRDIYRSFFTIIRDRIVIPNAGKLELADHFEDLSILFRKSGIKLAPHPAIDSMVNSLINSMSQNEYRWQFKIVKTALVLKTFNNEDWRDEFVKYLFDIPSAGCFASMEDAKRLAVLIRSVFNTCAELMECCERVVFSEVFWTKDILRQKANFMWILEVVWNLVFKENTEHMVIMPCWFALFKRALKEGDKELVFYMHMPLSHVYLNMCQTQAEFKVFNDQVELPLSNYIQKNMRKWGVRPNKKKLSDSGAKKIAFVFDRLVGNSPVKLLISLLTYLKNNTVAEIYVYDMGYVEKAISDIRIIEEVKSIGVHYVNNHDLITDAEKGHHYCQFDKALKLRDQAVKDDIDILVMTGNRLYSGFMFATRTAPLQIFWDHGNHEYNVRNIDKRICHFQDGYSNEFSYDYFELRMLEKYLKGEELECRAKAKNIINALPKHSIIFGSIGRISKQSEGYLETVARILNTFPDAIYLACGTGNYEEVMLKVNELGVTDRFLLKGWIDPHVYGYVLDIYLNTFPNPSGESLNEYNEINNGSGVITRRPLPENVDAALTKITLDEYYWNAVDKVVLLQQFGKEVLKDIYKVHSISQGNYKTRINENSEHIKLIKDQSETVRQNYPDTDIFLGIHGPVGLLHPDIINLVRQAVKAGAKIVFVSSEQNQAEVTQLAKDIDLNGYKVISTENILSFTFTRSIYIDTFDSALNPVSTFAKFRLDFCVAFAGKTKYEIIDIIMDGIKLRDTMAELTSSRELKSFHAYYLTKGIVPEFYNAIQSSFKNNTDSEFNNTVIEFLKCLSLPKDIQLLTRSLKSFILHKNPNSFDVNNISILLLSAELYQEFLSVHNSGGSNSLRLETMNAKSDIRDLLLISQKENEENQDSGRVHIALRDFFIQEMLSTMKNAGKSRNTDEYNFDYDAKNHTFRNLGIYFSLLLKRLQRQHVSKEDQAALGIVMSLMLAEYKNENLDKIGVKLLLQLLVCSGKVADIKEIIQKTYAKNEAPDMFIMCALAASYFNKLEQIDEYLKSAEIEKSDSISAETNLKLCFINTAIGDFDNAYFHLQKILADERDYFGKEFHFGYYMIFAVILKNFDIKASKNFLKRSQMEDPYYIDLKYKWDMVEASVKQYPPLGEIVASLSESE